MKGKSQMKTTKEISASWGVSPRYVTTLCSNGRLPGAVKEGKVWLIPDNTQKPMDSSKESLENITSNSFDYDTFEHILCLDNLYAMDSFITKTVANLYRNNDNNADLLYNLLLDSAIDMKKLQYLVSGFYETWDTETVYYVSFYPMAAIDPLIIVEFRATIDSAVKSTRSLAAASMNHILHSQIDSQASGNDNHNRVYMYGIGLCGDNISVYCRNFHPNL